MDLTEAMANTDARSSLRRKLAVASLFSIFNILAWNSSLLSSGSVTPVDFDFSSALGSSFELLMLQLGIGMTSGVGLVTSDGLWGDDSDMNERYKDEDIKILGFSDRNYLPIARVWYNRMTMLGYTEHHIVAHDEITYNALHSENLRVIPCFITNPDYGRPVKGLWQQIMAARLHLTMKILRNGTHVLITDVDNIFSRHVPLVGFLEEGYDVYHAYEMRYPTSIYNQFGFVVCSGHQFLRSSPATFEFMKLVLRRCSGSKCDDQVTYNKVFFYDLDIQWDLDGGEDSPNNVRGALRVNTTHPENTKLLVESFTGRSRVTNHTVKIWDRDFAWRLAGAIPEWCPSENNWLGMPTKLNDSLTGHGNKIHKKIAAFQVWDTHCRGQGVGEHAM
mmetsp:Transcript_9978/g.18244  ORF Transcript_9978/g.18244 Transcript_9978/m.18244 type:complete len:390 (+) Transcript_9978:92-1261(+)